MLSKNTTIVATFILFLIFTFFFYANYKRNNSGDDIYYVWQEGKRILEGRNPYKKISGSNMRDDNYYAIYFPLFYFFAAATQFLGLNTFDKWIVFWHSVSSLFAIGIGTIFFFIAHNKKNIFLAFFFYFFWVFNRWVLDGVLASYMDFAPIFFLLCSLLFLKKRRVLSYLFLGISLSLKQVAVFLLPLYLIWSWNCAKKQKFRKVFLSSVTILAVPFVVSAPFIIWDTGSFFKSIFFSATRHAGGSFGAKSFDNIIGLEGIFARFPMFFMMGLVYLANIVNKINKYLSVVFIMFTFVYFNPVLFYQQMCWSTCLIPLIFWQGAEESFS